MGNGRRWFDVSLHTKLFLFLYLLLTLSQSRLPQRYHQPRRRNTLATCYARTVPVTLETLLRLLPALRIACAVCVFPRLVLLPPFSHGHAGRCIPRPLWQRPALQGRQDEGNESSDRGGESEQENQQWYLPLSK